MWFKMCLRSSTLALFLACLPVSVAGEAAHTGLSANGIRRFHRVSENLYRGGQPNPAGFAFLKRQGIMTVVNLRAENDERPWVEKLGMKYVQIPLSAWDRVPDSAIRTFFEVLNDPDNQPVFVHCRRGADRTGVMVGLYRIAYQGWDGEQAYREARALGMRWWYRGLKRQLYEFSQGQVLTPREEARQAESPLVEGQTAGPDLLPKCPAL